MIITGSFAIKQHIPSFRTYKDIDIWIPTNAVSEFYSKNRLLIKKFAPQTIKNKFNLIIGEQRVELGLYEDDSAYDLIIQAERKPKTINIFGFDFIVPSLVSLYAIKKSHIYYPVKWEKHIVDYHAIRLFIKNSKQARDTKDVDLNILKQAYDRLASAVKSRQKPRLNMSNDEFFNKSQGAVKRIFKHDDIHNAVKYYSRPLFKYIKADSESAQCDRGMWDKLTDETKVLAVKEEAYVIALERYIIPELKSKTVKLDEDFFEQSFNRALQRICTTLTSGWFREFAVNNWPLCRQMDKDYVGEFSRALEAGKIRLFNEA